MEYGIELNPVDSQVLFNYFDKNEDGHINYDEFLFSLRVFYISEINK